MRSCAIRDPSVVHRIRSQVTRCHAVRIGIRPFGTKGSQVQILSPRPIQRLGVLRESGSSGASSFSGGMQSAPPMQQTIAGSPAEARRGHAETRLNIGSRGLLPSAGPTTTCAGAKGSGVRENVVTSPHSPFGLRTHHAVGGHPGRGHHAGARRPAGTPHDATGAIAKDTAPGGEAAALAGTSNCVQAAGRARLTSPFR